jgi:hypothetical protein
MTLCRHYKAILIELVGWFGMILILTGYALSSFNMIDQGALYQIINLCGAFGLIIVSYEKKNTQLTTLNGIWFFIALFHLIK